MIDFKMWKGFIPVDLEMASREANAVVKYGDFEYLGGVSTNHDHCIINLNQDLSLFSKRFAWAHCIGHIVLGHLAIETEWNDVTYHLNESNSYEKAANYFALELLMPTIMIKYAGKPRMFWEDKTLSCSTIQDFSKTFQVSTVAATERLRTLGMLPGFQWD